VLSELNRKVLKEHHTVFLDTNMEYVLRTLNTSKRPLLKDDPENWGRLYDLRLAHYQEVSCATINTADLKVRAVMERLEKEVSKL